MLVVPFLIIVSIAQLFISIGILIESRRSKSVSQRVFVALATSFLFWTLSLIILSFVDSKYSQSNLGFFNLINRFGFSLGALSLLMTYVFNRFYPSRLKNSKTMYLTYIFGVILIMLSFTKMISGAFSIDSGGALSYVPGAMSYIFSIFALYILVSVVTVNIKALKVAKDQETKSQIRTVLFGLVLTVIHAVVFLLILAPLFKNNIYMYTIGYLAPYYYIGFTVHGLVNQKLFDMRLVVYRAIVYTLSVASIGALYALAVYSIGGALINLSSVTYTQRLVFAALSLLIAVTFAPIVKFFNRSTTHLFFRDAYDTQEVLDKIGKLIVGSIDLHKLQKSSLDILDESLRLSYVGYVLKSDSRLRGEDFIGNVPNYNEGALKQCLTGVSKNIIVYDEISKSSNERAQAMRENDISLIVPLTTKNETVGYLISGSKKSGNIFSNQDKTMLTIASNELAVALQNAQRFEEIQAFNITLQEKVNEATRELKSTNRKLIELDEAKDEFISMASHQLRTPLTSIKGYLSMLLDGDMGKLGKDQTSALKEAFGSSQRMVFLISDFLNVSRIKTGKFVIEKSQVNLAEMVHEELSQLKELAESRNVQFKYDQPKEFPTVMLDDNKIRQVMMNMIDNAIYYTPIGGTVTVQLYVDAKEVVFKVIDTGIGVPKAERHKLFTKFFRAANARVARPDGTGLGLFMAQKIVLAQGGVIIFESEEGKGSTFGWRFPLSKIKP